MFHRWLLRATSVALFCLLIQFGSRFAAAQEAVYRCGNEYTNDAARAKSEKCKLLETGALVTIPSHKRAVDVQKPSQSSITRPVAKAVANSEQAAQQQKRDSDAKRIIESELKKTEFQLLDLRRQFDLIPANASSAELEKKLNLKQQMARHEADIVSLKRELRQ